MVVYHIYILVLEIISLQCCFRCGGGHLRLRLRSWLNVNPALVQRLVFAGYSPGVIICSQQPVLEER